MIRKLVPESVLVESETASEAESLAKGEREFSGAGQAAKILRQGKVRPDTGTSARGRARDLLAYWEAEIEGLSGQELLEAQWRIAKLAAERLSGMEMAEFFQAIEHNAHASVIDWLVTPAVSAMISSVDADEVKVFISEFENDKRRGEMLHALGLCFSDGDPILYLDSLKRVADKERFLSGYCVGRVFDEPDTVVDLFERLRPEGVGFAGLGPALNVLPKHTDFARLSSDIPGDHLTGAREMRSKLLNSWARYDPGSAARFVESSDGSVSPEQIRGVMASWLMSSRQEAERWAEEADPSPVRDIAISTIAESEFESSPSKAWDLALEVSERERRDRLLKELHAKWLELDSGAAEDARAAYDAGQRVGPNGE